jgi:hypothetical protein
MTDVKAKHLLIGEGDLGERAYGIVFEINRAPLCKGSHPGSRRRESR